MLFKLFNSVKVDKFIEVGKVIFILDKVSKVILYEISSVEFIKKFLLKLKGLKNIFLFFISFCSVTSFFSFSKLLFGSSSSTKTGFINPFGFLLRERELSSIELILNNIF